MNRDALLMVCRNCGEGTVFYAEHWFLQRRFGGLHCPRCGNGIIGADLFDYMVALSLLAAEHLERYWLKAKLRFNRQPPTLGMYGTDEFEEELADKSTYEVEAMELTCPACRQRFELSAADLQALAASPEGRISCPNCHHESPDGQRVEREFAESVGRHPQWIARLSEHFVVHHVLRPKP